MYFQIENVVLWPRKSGLKPRVIKFEPGKVNIITGASRTGKSAVTPIIDYCLGSKSCSIPVNTIRDACAWFGVVVITAQGQKLLARREPGDQQATEDMYLREAKEVIIPESIPGKNTNAEQVRRMLDELAGLTKLDFAGGDQTSGFLGRPSFRDMGAFVFQPQNVIANPDVFFFRADTHEHRQKLRTIFPYVLGAITPETLAKEHELRLLEADLRRKERELREVQEVSARWMAEIKAHVSTARELGLLGPASAVDLTKDALLDALREIVQRTDLTLKVTTTTISESLNEMSALEQEESTISSDLTTRRRRLAEMRRLKESSSDYQQALKIQGDRLKVADWLADLHQGDEGCPICGHALDEAGERLKQLVGALRMIEEEAGINKEIPAAFDLEMARVQQEVALLADRLEAVQIRRRGLTQRSSEAQRTQYQARAAERFVGALESSLGLYERVGTDSDLVAEVINLRERVYQLRRDVDERGVALRLDRALHAVNLLAGLLLPKLDVERPNDPVKLDVKDLTIRVVGPQREDSLRQIGSGSNWLSYHIAIILALQKFFRTLRNSSVPGFVVFDQPSQVYFPKKLASHKSAVKADTEPEVEAEPELDDEDVEAVRKAFAVMGQVIEESQGALQVLAFDHAPQSVWGNLPMVTLVEEWRSGRTLVPNEWLD
jgi:hypothetical protein